MPSFGDTAHSAAPPEEVWKLLGDPARFPEWWLEYPDSPMRHVLGSANGGRRVVITYQELRFEWRIEPDKNGTRIDVLVDIPEDESFQLGQQREVIRRSLERLAEVAAAATL